MQNGGIVLHIHRIMAMYHSYRAEVVAKQLIRQLNKADLRQLRDQLTGQSATQGPPTFTARRPNSSAKLLWHTKQSELKIAIHFSSENPTTLRAIKDLVKRGELTNMKAHVVDNDKDGTRPKLLRVEVYSMPL